MTVYKKQMQLSDKIRVVLTRNGNTEIIVDGEPFTQCKYILVQIDPDRPSVFDEITSIDDLIPFDQSGSFNERINRGEISDEDSFIAHCSNLQAWIENDYDTRILHSNLSFPLLKRLASCGDKKAGIKFKEEVAIRFQEGNDTVRTFLLEEFIDLENFTLEEIKCIDSNLAEDFNILLQYKENWDSLVNSKNIQDYFDYLALKERKFVYLKKIPVSIKEAKKYLRVYKRLAVIKSAQSLKCQDCSEIKINLMNKIITRNIKFDMMNPILNFMCKKCISSIINETKKDIHLTKKVPINLHFPFKEEDDDSSIFTILDIYGDDISEPVIWTHRRKKYRNTKIIYYILYFFRFLCLMGLLVFILFFF